MELYLITTGWARVGPLTQIGSAFGVDQEYRLHEGCQHAPRQGTCRGRHTFPQIHTFSPDLTISLDQIQGRPINARTSKAPATKRSPHAQGQVLPKCLAGGSANHNPHIGGGFVRETHTPSTCRTTVLLKLVRRTGEEKG